MKFGAWRKLSLKASSFTKAALVFPRQGIALAKLLCFLHRLDTFKNPLEVASTSLTCTVANGCRKIITQKRVVLY